MRAEFSRSTGVRRSSRVTQVEGIFDIAPSEHVERTWSIDLPIEDQDWHVGLVVGPSGSGKTTLLEEVFGGPFAHPGWPAEASVLDEFPDEMTTDEIVSLLSAVGFSSPPTWLRPFDTLSTGEQFRAELAWQLAVAGDELAVIDEFTSTVDRTVARTASVAVSRHVRRHGTRLVVASCHYDIVDWLQPDWVFDTALGSFTWRSLHPRPSIDIDIRCAERTEWAAFAPHHYLSGNLSLGARCYVGEVDGRLATFVAVHQTPSPAGYSLQREHRTVCLPDYQGVGLGHATADTVAACYRARGWRFRSVASHPAVIHYRAKSPLWKMTREPSHEHVMSAAKKLGSSAGRRTAAFEFVGPAAPGEWAAVLEVPAFRSS